MRKSLTNLQTTPTESEIAKQKRRAAVKRAAKKELGCWLYGLFEVFTAGVVIFALIFAFRILRQIPTETGYTAIYLFFLSVILTFVALLTIHRLGVCIRRGRIAERMVRKKSETEFETDSRTENSDK